MCEQRSKQTTRHILLIEPAEFYANPQTMETNHYQLEENESKETVFQYALDEFRVFRNALVEKGVFVTTLKGDKGCPDHIFPNWASTHHNRIFNLYPMRNENRRQERSEAMVRFLEKSYDLKLDYRDEEKQGCFLESTGSMVLDHVNRVVYSALSKRTSEALVRRWANDMDYDVEVFETENHKGQPVYHTDVVMFIGQKFAGICADNILSSDRDRVLSRLSKTHDIVQFSKEQLIHFCGNALEVKGYNNRPFLVMSQGAHSALDKSQKERVLTHVDAIISADIRTIEAYGGGSARCLMMEMF